MHHLNLFTIIRWFVIGSINCKNLNANALATRLVKMLYWWRICSFQVFFMYHLDESFHPQFISKKMFRFPRAKHNLCDRMHGNLRSDFHVFNLIQQSSSSTKRFPSGFFVFFFSFFFHAHTHQTTDSSATNFVRPCHLHLCYFHIIFTCCSHKMVRCSFFSVGFCFYESKVSIMQSTKLKLKSK